MINNYDVDENIPPHWISNWLIVHIVTLCVVLFIVGIRLSLDANLIGPLLGLGGTAMLAFGLKYHKNEPFTVGVITVWGKYLDTRANVVYGWVPLLPFCPFWIDTKEIDASVNDFDFPVENVLSNDGVPMSGIVSLTMGPDIDRLIRYVRVGEERGVIRHIDQVVNVQLTRYCSHLNWRTIQERSADMEPYLLEEIRKKDLGMQIESLQVVISAPEELLREVMAVEEQTYRSEAERIQFQATLDEAIKRRQAVIASQGSKRGVPQLPAFIRQIDNERLGRKNRAFRVVTDGKGFSMPVIQVNDENGSRKRRKK